MGSIALLGLLSGVFIFEDGCRDADDVEEEITTTVVEVGVCRTCGHKWVIH